MRAALTLALVAAPALAAAESRGPDYEPRPVDVLVVLDSAPTAAGARAALADEIGAFVTQLEARFPQEYEDGTALSLHLGFITGDLGAGAACGPGDGARLQIASVVCFTTAAAYPWVIAEHDGWGPSGNIVGTTAEAVRCAMPPRSTAARSSSRCARRSRRSTARRTATPGSGARTRRSRCCS